MKLTGIVLLAIVLILGVIAATRGPSVAQVLAARASALEAAATFCAWNACEPVPTAQDFENYLWTGE